MAVRPSIALVPAIILLSSLPAAAQTTAPAAVSAAAPVATVAPPPSDPSATGAPGAMLPAVPTNMTDEQLSKSIERLRTEMMYLDVLADRQKSQIKVLEQSKEMRDLLVAPLRTPAAPAGSTTSAAPPPPVSTPGTSGQGAQTGGASSEVVPALLMVQGVGAERRAAIAYPGRKEILVRASDLLPDGGRVLSISLQSVSIRYATGIRTIRLDASPLGQ